MVKKLMNFNQDIWELITRYKKDFKFNDDAEAIRDLIRNGLIHKGYIKIEPKTNNTEAQNKV